MRDTVHALRIIKNAKNIRLKLKNNVFTNYLPINKTQVTTDYSDIFDPTRY